MLIFLQSAYSGWGGGQVKLNFTKMQGAGNDYIYVDCRARGLPPDAAAWAVQL